jgi:hypothetical protein
MQTHTVLITTIAFGAILATKSFAQSAKDIRGPSPSSQLKTNHRLS